jgi:hypothetical protein
MCFEGDVSVGCVLRGEICGEVVEAAVVRFADEGDGLEKELSGGGIRVRDVVDVAEAVSTLDGG